jgi:hypothetical protein
MDHLIILYLLLRGRRCGCSAPSSASRTPFFPDIPWRAIGVCVLVFFLVIALTALAMGNPVAGRIILASLVLYAIFRRGRLVQWWRANADRKLGRVLKRIGMFYVFWGLLWGLLQPVTGLGSRWAIIPVFTILIVLTALKRYQLVRWWQAFDERGRPIEVEVLPPAPVTGPASGP